MNTNRYAWHVRQSCTGIVGIYGAGATQPQVLMTIEQAEYVAACLKAWADASRAVLSERALTALKGGE